MQNLARNNYSKNYDDQVKEELISAGISVEETPFPMIGEVKTRYFGTLCGFVFHRAWTYWVVEKATVPKYKAKILFDSAPDFLGIRAYGLAGKQEPDSDVDTYHIDTLAGLWYFAEFIKHNMDGAGKWRYHPRVTSCLQEDNKAEFIGQIVDIFEDYLDENKTCVSIAVPDRQEAIDNNETDEDSAAQIYGRAYDCIEEPTMQVIEEFHLLDSTIQNRDIMQKIAHHILDGFNDMVSYYKNSDTRTDEQKYWHEKALRLEIENTFLAWKIYQ